MKKINIVLLFLSLILIISSCQKQIEIEYPELEPKLVISSLFTPDSLFKVRITNISGMNDISEIIVTDATCEIWSNSQLLETLQHNRNGFYVSELLKPEIEKNYTIKVSHPNFETATATSYVPQKTTFVITDTTNFVEIDFLYETCFFEATIQFIETKSQNNFYEIIVKDIKFLNNEKKELDFEQYVTRYKSQNIAIMNEGILEYEPNALVFSNEKITEQTYNLSFSYELGVLYYWTHHIHKHNAVIYFLSVSEDYYQYKKRLIKHKENQYSNIWDGAGDPVEMYSNVKNGYGIFAGYQICTDTIFY